ncbi:AI-2E family transporter [Halodesulfovibrio marinisediminis]|uniref:Predicted PurR-regulated permease PerM n=1 Tax=Halodesulfovibrio marinisediminis DSM 17456 TaxID=1121457 RepID=A0A1N6E978_9BACT|nr:AI-2E family transporter [Halodesulfovibrio marinisediminis]SIN79578.1 Predicted PurR-regulated permease PerM [Halodesulfovibrio marinisediminis DSM 17456]
MNRKSRLRDSVLTIAGILLILFAARVAQGLVIPFLLSIFISIIITVPVGWLKRCGFSNLFAVGIVVLITLFFEVGIALFLGKSASQFSRSIPEYQAQLAGLMGKVDLWLLKHNIELPESSLSEVINPNVVLGFANSFISGLGKVLSNVALIMFTVFFMLLEGHRLPQKIHAIDHAQEGELLKKCTFILESTKQYISIKALTSLITGVFITIGLTLIGLNFASLWGFLAFILNFIPTIGSILAAAPAVLMSCLQLGLMETLSVLALYLAVNIVIGNIVEPAVMGHKVGLSTLAVFLSLVFWGWLLGPAGMLLSVPLTMLIKYGAEANPQTRWLAVLLGPAPPQEETIEE